MSGAIPITSLAEMLAVREAFTTDTSFLADIGKKVGDKIAKAREEKREQTRQANANKIAQQRFDQSQGNTTSNKLIPKLTLDTNGNLKYTATSETPSQRATRIKTQRENIIANNQENIIKEFNKPGSTLTVTDLINAQIKPSDAITMDEQRGLISSNRNYIKNQYDNISSSVNNQQNIIPQSSGNIIQEQGSLVSPELTPAGKPKKIIDTAAQSIVDTAAADVQVSKEVKSQMEKAGELAKRGTQRASSASGTALDEVFRFNKENLDKYGIKPGTGFGYVEKLMPDQLNRYKAAAVGAGREAAATVGTQIIPAARAVRMVDIFAKSTAEVGNTVEGNAANSAASMGNVWGNALSANFPIEMKYGSKKRLKDVVKDPLTGKYLSDIQYPEILTALQRATEDFKLKTEQYYLQKAYDKYPDILQTETRMKFDKQKRLKRIEELRSKM